MKLILVSQAKCMPCQVMKNQILNRIEEFEALDVVFEYLDINEMQDKDTFIQMHKLSSTPTAMIEKDEQIVWKHNGYIDINTLLETIGGF